MIAKTMYKCDHCRKVMTTVGGITRHEKHCLKNPNGYNCYNCAKAYVGYWEHDEYHHEDFAAICAYREDVLRENDAETCSGYQRVDALYSERTAKDAELALEESP